MTVFDVRRFLLAKIRESNPDFEVRSGSAAGTMMVKPFSVMVSPFEDELELIKTQLSLSDVSTLGSDAVDQLISNLFIDRRNGSFASGKIRIYFSSAQDATISSGTGFLDGSGQVFIAESDTTISQAEMSLNKDGSQYYMEVNIVASNPGDSYNVGANEIVSLENDIPGVIRVTNPSAVKNGLPTETDQEYVDRAGRAITVRNLTNKRSISTVLLNEFNTLISLQSIGFRDPEMTRDIVEIITSQGPRDIHIGGHGDIYIEPLENQIVYTDIPSSAMSGELSISTNSNRGLITYSEKPGLYIDITPGFFGQFEIEEQFGVKLDPSSTYYIYLDSNGSQQLDNVSVAFPTNSTPLAIVTTDSFEVTNIVDSRSNVIEFSRPMTIIDSVTELDPVSLTETDRILSDGNEILFSGELDTSPINDPFQAHFDISVTGDTFTVYEDSGDIYLSGHDEDGNIVLASQNISDPSGSISSISRNPTISIDSFGKIHILFEDDRAGQFDVHYTRLDQLGSVEVAVLSPGATSGIESLDHVLDESGNIHLTYIEGSNSLEYQKLDNSGSILIAATTISSSSHDKVSADISVNGNTTTTSVTGSANGSNLFDDTITGFPPAVQAGQTLVLTGGSLEYSAILDGSISEPGPFSATLTGTTSSSFMDTSIGTGNNTAEFTVDGVIVNVTFTDTTLNPIATVINEINIVSLAGALAASIASNNGSDQVLITSPTTGLGSTINITGANAGIGFVLGAASQGGSGYNTSIVDGLNTMDLRVDGTDLNIIFTDTNGNSLVNVINEINSVAFAELGANIASDGGGIVRLTSPDVGVDAYIEVVDGHSAIGFVTDDREEGGNELGRRIGITGVAATQLTLSETIRTISISADISYTIESIEAGMVWVEDSDIFVAKINDSASIFLSATNLSHSEVQASQTAVPTINAMVNGPGANEITFEDTTALFITNNVTAGNTLRVTSATPSSAEGDYIIKQVDSETQVILTGTLSSSPANSVTYEVFQTLIDSQPHIGTNTDNESQILWIENKRKINRIELDRLGAVVSAKSTMTTRPEDVSSMNLYVDSSDAIHVAWIERDSNSGNPYMMRIDEYGDITLDPVMLIDSLENGSNLTIKTTIENEPCIIWLGLDNSGSTTNSRLLTHRRSAQDYFFRINNPSIRLSVYEDNSIVFTKEFLDQPVRINYRTSEDVQTIEDFVHSSEQQIIDSNYMVKHIIPAIVNVSIKYRGDINDARQVVIDFINSVDEDTLEASDIADSLYEAGATFVELPFTIMVTYNDIDGARTFSSSQDSISIPRIARFIAEEDNITITDLE